MNGDIAIVWDVNHGEFSLTADGGDLLTDPGLETAVIVSLFSDARAGEHDELPATETERRGWWGGDFEETPFGSKLWLLSREKQMRSVVARAEEYATAALAWMKKDRVALAVKATGTIPRPGWLHLQVEITRPDGRNLNLKYDYNWRAQEARAIENAV
ncbi:MAG: phage GP46 family protein [Planctomycetota bacterium]|jgi:phage gp46-like protein|nr:phage GP46 family protein [Planctomycetota bacterium]